VSTVDRSNFVLTQRPSRTHLAGWIVQLLFETVLFIAFVATLGLVTLSAILLAINISIINASKPAAPAPQR
jgi:hypothetical protein